MLSTLLSLHSSEEKGEREVFKKRVLITSFSSDEPGLEGERGEKRDHLDFVFERGREVWGRRGNGNSYFSAWPEGRKRQKGGSGSLSSSGEKT